MIGDRLAIGWGLNHHLAPHGDLVCVRDQDELRRISQAQIDPVTPLGSDLERGLHVPGVTFPDLCFKLPVQCSPHRHVQTALVGRVLVEIRCLQPEVQGSVDAPKTHVPTVYGREHAPFWEDLQMGHRSPPTSRSKVGNRPCSPGRVAGFYLSSVHPRRQSVTLSSDASDLLTNRVSGRPLRFVFSFVVGEPSDSPIPPGLIPILREDYGGRNTGGDVGPGSAAPSVHSGPDFRYDST